MDKRILYVGGGFDILHQDHKRFILKGINSFKKKFGNLQKIIIGLESDINLKKIKVI